MIKAAYLLSASTEDGARSFQTKAADLGEVQMKTVELQRYAIDAGTSLWLTVQNLDTFEHETRKVYGDEDAASLHTLGPLFRALGAK